MSATASAIAGCSTLSSVVGEYSNGINNIALVDTRKRKKRCVREAAFHIAPIDFGASGPRPEITTANSFRGPDSTASLNTQRTEVSDDENNDEIKRTRHSSGEQFDSVNDLGYSAKYPGSASDRECSPQADHTLPELNGKSLYGYKFCGAGKDLYAIHISSQVQMQCQIINKEQYFQVVKVMQRLNEAEKFWLYEDAAELSNFVFPDDTEIYEWQKGQYILLSPWQYGNLDINLLRSKTRGNSEDTVRPLFKQIVRGVAFCHCLGIMVRDLKPRKFVYGDSARTTVRLHDVFGLYVCDDVSSDTMTDHHGVPAYVAPEVLRRVPVEYAGKPADIWALGVLLFYLLFGKHPFNDSTLPRIFMRICRVCFSIPSNANVSQVACSLIHGIFKKEPCDRPTAEQLLYLPWVSGHKSQQSTIFPSWRVLSVTGGAVSRQYGIPVNPVGSIRQFPRSSRRRRNNRFNAEDQVVPGIQNSDCLNVDPNTMILSVGSLIRFVGRNMEGVRASS